jgi:hypothetical protein
LAQAGRRWQRRTIFPWFIEHGFTHAIRRQRRHAAARRRQAEWAPRHETHVVGVCLRRRPVLPLLNSHDDEHSLYSQFTTALQERWSVLDDELGPAVSDLDLLGIEIKRRGAWCRL